MMKLYLLHGAGAGHSSDFLSRFRRDLEAALGVVVEPITMAYMQEIERSGNKRPPPAIHKLIDEIAQEISQDQPIILLGKSMGSRIIAELCKSHNIKACVALGFPFYPAKKPEKNRLYHFESTLDVPYFIVQGTRDTLGSREWVSQQYLPTNVNVRWVEGADHDFNVLKRYNRSPDSVMNELVVAVSEFIVPWLREEK